MMSIFKINKKKITSLLVIFVITLNQNEAFEWNAIKFKFYKRFILNYIYLY